MRTYENSREDVPSIDFKMNERNCKRFQIEDLKAFVVLDE